MKKKKKSISEKVMRTQDGVNYDYTVILFNNNNNNNL